MDKSAFSCLPSVNYQLYVDYKVNSISLIKWGLRTLCYYVSRLRLINVVFCSLYPGQLMLGRYLCLKRN